MNNLKIFKRFNYIYFIEVQKMGFKRRFFIKYVIKFPIHWLWFKLVVIRKDSEGILLFSGLILINIIQGILVSLLYFLLIIKKSIALMSKKINMKYIAINRTDLFLEVDLIFILVIIVIIIVIPIPN
jgi:hypothetical protein